MFIFNKELKNELRFLGSNYKGKLFIKNFRYAAYFTKTSNRRKIGLPIRAYYKVFFNYILGIDIPDTTKIGFGFNVFHGQSIVINDGTIIGNYVTIRQNTTIGNAKVGGKCPVISDHVDIGANVCIIGEITIGSNVIIAAGSVVIANVPPNVMVAGNPAIIKKYLK